MDTPNKKIYADGDPRKRSWKKRQNAKKEENRSEYVAFRLTPSELKKVKDKAAKIDVQMSDFLRSAALNLRPQVKNRQMDLSINALNRVGHNLNQMTRLAHEGRLKDIADAEALESLLDKLDAAIDTLLEEVA